MQEYKVYRQIYAGVSASLILISVGYHIGWASPSLAKLQAVDSDVLITSSQGSWIASFPLIGSIFGSFLSFFLVDKCGRKLSILLMAIPLFLSCVLMAVANNYWWFYVARFVAGIGLGSLYGIVPMYIGEIAEDRVRGGLVTLIGVMTNVGNLIPYSIGPWVSRVVLAAVGAVIPIVFTLVFVWAPESPYYFAMKNAQHKTEKSLTWLRGSPDVAEEVIQIQKNVDSNQKPAGTVMDLFTVKSNRKALIIVFGLLISGQFSGSAALITYSTIIMDEVNAGISSSIVVIIIGVVQLVGSILIIFLADTLGRRPLLLGSAVLCTIFILAQAVYFQLQATAVDVTNITWLPVLALIGFFVAHSGGLGTLPVVMSAELFPCEVKAIAMAVIGLLFCTSGVVVTKAFQIISDAYGVHVTFYIFTVFGIVSTIFIFFVVPETKNRSLSDIQDDLQGNSVQPMLARSTSE